MLCYSSNYCVGAVHSSQARSVFETNTYLTTVPYRFRALVIMLCQLVTPSCWLAEACKILLLLLPHAGDCTCPRGFKASGSSSALAQQARRRTNTLVVSNLLTDTSTGKFV